MGKATNEVTRVLLEVSTEGILGGQASVPDVQGMWKVHFVGNTPHPHASISCLQTLLTQWP